MARAHGGRDSEFHLDDSGNTLRDLSQFVTSVDAPHNQDTAEITGFGDVRKSFVLGQIDTTVSVSGNFDNTATTGPHVVLTSLINGSAGYQLRYFPAGSASGNPELSGKVLLGSYNISSPLGDKVSFSASLFAADTTGVVWSVI